MDANLGISKIHQGFYTLKKLWILKIYPIAHPTKFYYGEY